jgi:hypothetical protein
MFNEFRIQWVCFTLKVNHPILSNLHIFVTYGVQFILSCSKTTHFEKKIINEKQRRKFYSV